MESSENPSTYGDSVTFTVAVSPISSATGLATPTGEVEFFDGTSLLDTATLSGGSASFSTSELAIAADQLIEAQYLGDSNYNPSNNTIEQTVNPPTPATLSGEVYTDSNGSGNLTSNAGLAGWAVSLMNGATQLATTTTNSGGNYTFSDVYPGSYTIVVFEQSGYVASVPSSGLLAVTASAGQTINNLNFGEFQTVGVSGEVFNDASDSGSLSASDPGISGWTVELVQGSTILQTVSGTGGAYSISDVGPGIWTLEVAQQTGWVPTNSPITITPTSGTNVTSENLGEFQTATISGQVYDDLTGSGTYASGDDGLEGWTIDLVNSAHSVVASTQTDSNGHYTLSGVGLGTFTIEEMPMSGYVQTTAPAVYSETTTEGQDINGVNFGDFAFATVSGEVFGDLQDDGTLETGDPGLAGWTVDLLNSASKDVATTITGTNGDYSFGGVGPGTYSVSPVAQAGYRQTAPSSGGLSVTASSGAEIGGQDLGVFKAVSLAVSGLAIAPASGLQSGMSVAVKWADTNTGTLPASGSFSDRVVITNTTTDTVLGTGEVLYNAASLGNLARVHR